MESFNDQIIQDDLNKIGHTTHSMCHIQFNVFLIQNKKKRARVNPTFYTH